MQITFIGGGNMASAIIAGLHQQADHLVRVIDRNPEKLASLAGQYGIQPLTGIPAAGFSANDVLILSVKPQQLKVLCAELAPVLHGALVVSVAAGLRSDVLMRWLNTDRLIRVMPNTPVMVGKGLTGLFAVAGVSVSDRQRAQRIMQSVGQTVWLEQESRIDDITCISGSGPAYVFYFVEAMMEAASQLGFTQDEARTLVLSTFDGAIALARQSDLPVETLRANVTSRGGATAKAIARYDQEALKAVIIAGAMDCRARSIEMGDQLSQD